MFNTSIRPSHQEQMFVSRSRWILSIALLTACTSCSDMTQHSFQVISEDGGVPVAVTSGGPKYSGELFTYEKVMVLDTEQNEDALLFRPTQFMADDAGNMYINDTGIGSILAFDATGSYTHMIGRMGSGPGESTYGQIQLIHDGMIQFYGIKERRTTRFNPDGSIVDITTMPAGIDLFGNTGFIILPDKRQLILTNETQIGDENSLKGAKESINSENQRWGAIVLSKNGNKVSEAFTPWTQVEKMIDVSFQGNIYAYAVPIAFGPQPTAHFHPTHGIVLSLSEQPVLEIYDLTGRKTRSIRLELDTEPVTPAEKSRVRQIYLETSVATSDGKPVDWESIASKYPFADQKAYWGMVEIDEDGYFWLDLSMEPESQESNIHEFMVLSPEGEYLGNTSRPYKPDTYITRGRMYILEEDPDTGEILPTVYRINPAVSGFKYPN